MLCEGFGGGAFRAAVESLAIGDLISGIEVTAFSTKFEQQQRLSLTTPAIHRMLDVPRGKIFSSRMFCAASSP
jgi:hypothetical protein